MGTTSPPLDNFLNDYLVFFDDRAPFFGVLTVAIFAMYLLCCVASGCFKFGLRFFCIALHPMKYNGTMMNSFLFNLGLIMLTALPAVRFTTKAFSNYARSTSVQVLLGVQVEYMRF